MANEKNRTHKFLQCGHCRNQVPMDIVAEYYLPTEHTYDDPDDAYYDCCNGIIYAKEGYHHKLLLCLVCNEVTYWRYFDADYLECYEKEIFFPSELYKLSGLPNQIQKAYDIALKVRGIDTNAYAVLLGRILDIICEDRKALGNTLNKKLIYLAEKGEIPEKLVRVAHNLRNLRNYGAHADLGELTIDEIPILDDLCKAILEYIYNAPYLAEKAERSLNRLKEKQSKNKKRMIETSKFVLASRKACLIP